MELGELPVGWETAELSEICLLNPTIDKSAIADDLAVSFVPMPAVQAECGAIDVSATRKFGEVKKGYTPFREGDVLFAKITPCMENGKMAVVPALQNGLGFGSTEFHVLRAHPGISPQFVYYFVSSRAFRHVAEHNMSGAVGQRRVTTPYLSACKIPVPPTAEQLRIVAKIEELFSELDQGVASLKTAREQLKVYRQSLLKNAFEGKLTAAWRAAHRDQLETATTLQQRIAREREARYQQQLADWQAANKPGPKPGPKPKAPKPLPPLTPEELAELPELPAGWGWLRLGCVLDAVSGNTPKGVEQTSGREIPFYRVSDMNREGNELYMNSSATYLSKAEAKALGLTIYPAGTILFPKRGGAIATNKKRRLLVPACFDLNLMGLTNLPNGIGLGYLWNWVLSLDLASISDGSNVPQINNRNVEPLAFPVCSLTEQFEIVQELESKLSEADQLDQTLATALQQADALRQSILKKAFCGQLVPQDPNDEPATALLERIRAARSTNPPARRGRSARSQA